MQDVKSVTEFFNFFFLSNVSERSRIMLHNRHLSSVRWTSTAWKKNTPLTEGLQMRSSIRYSPLPIHPVVPPDTCGAGQHTSCVPHSPGPSPIEIGFPLHISHFTLPPVDSRCPWLLNPLLYLCTFSLASMFRFCSPGPAGQQVVPECWAPLVACSPLLALRGPSLQMWP